MGNGMTPEQVDGYASAIQAFASGQPETVASLILDLAEYIGGTAAGYMREVYGEVAYAYLEGAADQARRHGRPLGTGVTSAVSQVIRDAGISP